jgi:hypothetical protein
MGERAVPGIDGAVDVEVVEHGVGREVRVTLSAAWSHHIKSRRAACGMLPVEIGWSPRPPRCR